MNIDTHSTSQRLLLTAGLLTLAACSDSTAPIRGAIRVTATTTGADLPLAGYSVSVDSGAGQAVPTNGAVAISGLNAGRHSVTLYGIAANCVLSGVNTRAVEVLAGDTVRVAFDVACTAVGGASRQIAFVSDRDGNFEIYLMNADGSSQTRLTNNPATDFQPAWSPDGKKIAFTSMAEVYVMNADGSSPTRLTYSSPDWDSASQAAWSPDGSKIALTRASSDYYCDPDGLCSGGYSTLVISVINADGTGIHDLASGSGAAWSPDGTRIAFRGDGGINVLNADGSGGRHVIAAIGGQHLAWSPDAAKIAFDGATYTSPLSAPQWDIYILNADGSGTVRLTQGSGNNYFPAWRP